MGFCSQENELQVQRPWWEPPYVVYSFNNPRVRLTLERLMGTDIVRVTDREFMLKLQNMKRQDHEERVRRRIHDREVGEVERIKRLILEGKMPMEEAPKELSDHPVFKIEQLVKKIVEENKLKAEKKRKRQTVERLNYDSLERKADVGDSEVSSCIEFDMSDANRDIMLKNREEYIKEGLANFTEEDRKRIKYVDPLVEELEDTEEVDELYTLADEIMNPSKN